MTLRVSPAVDTTPEVVRLVITDVAGTRLLTKLYRVELSQGSDGSTSEWVSEGRLLAMTMVERGMNQPVSFSLRCAIQSGVGIGSVAADLVALRGLREGSTVCLSLAHGPVLPITTVVALDESIVPASLVAMLDALRIIQNHTHAVVIIPDSAASDDVDDIIRSAALLESLAVTGDLGENGYEATVDPEKLGPGADEAMFDTNFGIELVVDAGRTLRLPHQTVELAEDLCFVRLLRSVRIAEILDEDSDGLVRVSLEPGPIPLRVDHRISSEADLTDELSASLYEHVEPVPIDELSAALASLGR